MIHFGHIISVCREAGHFNGHRADARDALLAAAAAARQVVRNPVAIMITYAMGLASGLGYQNGAIWYLNSGLQVVVVGRRARGCCVAVAG